MLIGLPKEIKNHEYRVGLTPASVRDLTAHGHKVLVQTGAGALIGLTDEQYTAAGATLAATAADVFAAADMIVKVKEPQPVECAMLRPGQILYTYLHLAPDPDQTAALVKSGAVCIAYETITGPGGGLPLQAPISVDDAVHDADLVVGGVLIPGAAAPKLVSRAMISRMRKGAVVVDVAIDQGGCFETSHATTHAEPTYVVDGAVARTSTFALNNATIGHAVALADKGWKQALMENVHLKAGLNVCNGHVTYEAVAKDLGYAYVNADTLLG